MAVLKIISSNKTEYTVKFTPPASFKELVGGDMFSSLKMPCGGRGACGKCRVLFKGSALLPDKSEERLLGKDLEKGVRLACRLVLTGDASVNLFEEKKSDVLLEGDESGTGLPLSPMSKGLGAAVDIGTTTVATRLYCLESGELLASCGIENPQGAFGADVVSRIEKALSGSLEALHRAVVDAIYETVSLSLTRANRDISELSVIVASGNTAMSYLAANKSPESISHAPFESEDLFGGYYCSEYFKERFKDAKLYLLPCISAYIGGDITAAMLATDIDTARAPSLLIDIGTNGETVLFNGSEYFGASAAAGPAFEGAGLSCGVGAVAGAISSVTAVNGKLFAKTLGNERAVGICGSGVIDLVASLIEIGELDETGYIENDAVIDGVRFTKEDIRAVQLAKGAIYGCISALLASAGTEVSELSQVFIAGGFGNKINIKNAEIIKMLPKGMAPIASSYGNAALGGTSRFLLYKEYREKAVCLAKQVKTVELATSPVFMEEYINGMMF